MYLPEGAFAPVPTPFDESDGFDDKALTAHLNWLKTEGLHGALILGTNGEFPSCSYGERLIIAEAAAEADSGLKLILNAGSCAWDEVIDLAEQGASAGYAALLCPPPWYFRQASISGLADFFKRLLDEAKVPVMLYHIPQVTGVPISDELLDAIGEHERLVGVKDSTGDESEMARLLPRFQSYLVGHDKLISKCLAEGGKGSISACASVVPDLVASIKSKPDQQGKLNSVRGLLEKFGLGASVKAILHKKGFGDYAARPPMTDIDPKAEAQLMGMLDMFGAIKW